MNHGPSQVTLAVICESVSRALELEGTASVAVLTFKSLSRLGYRVTVALAESETWTVQPAALAPADDFLKNKCAGLTRIGNIYHPSTSPQFLMRVVKTTIYRLNFSSIQHGVHHRRRERSYQRSLRR